MRVPYPEMVRNIDLLTSSTPQAESWTVATGKRSAFYLAVLLECAEYLTPEEFAECVTRAQHKDQELDARIARGELLR